MRLHRLHHASSSVIHIRWTAPRSPGHSRHTRFRGKCTHTRLQRVGGHRYIERKVCALNVRHPVSTKAQRRFGRRHREAEGLSDLATRTRRGAGASSPVQINREEPVDTQGTSSPGTYREVAERARVRCLGCRINLWL